MRTATLSTQTRQLRMGAAALLALLVSGALAACGSGADAQSSGTGVPKDVEKTYNKCLKAEGYPEVANGKAGAPGKDPIWEDEGFLAAQEKCEESSGLNSYKPEGHGANVNREEQDKKTLAITKCLREQGWKIEDPERTDEGLRLRMPQVEGEERQREFRKDFKKCGDKAGVSVDNDGAGEQPGDGEGDGGHDHDSHDHGEN